MCDYDPEILIEEVKKRPPLWDPRAGDYAHKAIKERCWRDISKVFNDDEKASAYERNELTRQLKRKWKSLRDCFCREVSKRRKIASGKIPEALMKRHSTYVYYKPMSFLLNAGKGRDEEDSAECEEAEGELPLADAGGEGDEDDDEPLSNRTNPLKVEIESAEDHDVDNDIDSEEELPPPSPPKSLKLKKRRKLLRPAPPSRRVQKKLARAAACSSQASSCREETERKGGGSGESERMFLLSLLEPLMQVPAHMRLAVQMDMMSVIQNAINAKNPEFVIAEAEVEYDDD